MERLLYQLFEGEYDITPKPDETQQQLYQKLLTAWNKVEDGLGQEFADHLGDLEGERENWQNYQYYRSGFILGAACGARRHGPPLHENAPSSVDGAPRSSRPTCVYLAKHDPRFWACGASAGG